MLAKLTESTAKQMLGTAHGVQFELILHFQHLPEQLLLLLLLQDVQQQQ
jgi:hypothetical protein